MCCTGNTVDGRLTPATVKAIRATMKTLFAIIGICIIG